MPLYHVPLIALDDEGQAINGRVLHIDAADAEVAANIAFSIAPLAVAPAPGFSVLAAESLRCQGHYHNSPTTIAKDATFGIGPPGEVVLSDLAADLNFLADQLDDAHACSHCGNCNPPVPAPCGTLMCQECRRTWNPKKPA